MGRTITMNTLAILPVKGNSERVPRKNLRPVGKYSSGITEIKMKQLQKSQHISEIFVSSESDEVLDLVSKFPGDKPVHLHKRDPQYAGTCPGDVWVKHLSQQVADIPADNIAMIFATAPFFTEHDIDNLLEFYADSEYDSVATANEIKNFLWKDGEPINYDPDAVGYWPLTQTLEPVYEINSAVFVSRHRDFVQTGSRLPGKIGFYKSSWMASLDIDYPDDWKRFELLWQTYTK